MSWMFLILLVHCTTADVFLRTQDAKQVLTRQRRANSVFEEFKKGNMERECLEERCNYEEAREIFEDVQKTDEFWHVYVDGDACLSHPCLNGGVCKDGIGLYECFCPAGFKGYSCEIAVPEFCESDNGGCQHFCRVEQKSVVCSCAKGYELSGNGKSCESPDPFKCGVVHHEKTRTIFLHVPNRTETESAVRTETLLDLPDTWNQTDSIFGLVDLADDDRIEAQSKHEDLRIVNGAECPPGECPWQALLLNEDNIGFCGGTILNTLFILSAAHCMNQSASMKVVVGEFDMLITEGHESIHDVDQILIHMHYIPETYHNDIALIKLREPIRFSKYILPACLPERDFAERVLMRQEEGLVSGFGRVREGGLQSTVLQKLTMPYVERATCIESSKFKISNRMFCAGYDEEAKDACQGDSGGPHVTRFKGTWFVTGVVSWGEGCARKGKYGVYTQVSKYINWIHNAMSKALK